MKSGSVQIQLYVYTKIWYLQCYRERGSSGQTRRLGTFLSVSPCTCTNLPSPNSIHEHSETTLRVITNLHIRQTWGFTGNCRKVAELLNGISLPCIYRTRIAHYKFAQTRKWVQGWTVNNKYWSTVCQVADFWKFCVSSTVASWANSMFGYILPEFKSRVMIKHCIDPDSSWYHTERIVRWRIKRDKNNSPLWWR